MNYREAMEYVERTSRYGISPGLDSIRELCRRMGDPQKGMKYVHVAGTNGKGSVSAYAVSVLVRGGYRVGRYLSPALFDYREEIQVNNRYITRKSLCRGMELLKENCDGMAAEGLPHPTMFEIKTALAFWYFREEKCDIVVLETGMGGLQDATNVVEDTCTAVITSISMDHMQFLGNTLAEIAAQKAGILKPGCRVVSAAQKPEVAEVIEKRAADLGCSLTIADEGRASHVKYGLEKQRFDYGIWKGMEINLGGQYQVGNAVVALEVLRSLAEQGFTVSDEQLRRGMSEARWPGRFTVLGKRPYFIVDGAHDEDGARKLAESVRFYFPGKRLIFIMGMLKDKEYGKMLALTHDLADQIITLTPPDNPRALSAYELAQEAAKLHGNVTAADSLEEAVEMGRLLAGKEDVILAFGSLSFLGRVMEITGYASEKGDGKEMYRPAVYEKAGKGSRNNRQGKEAGRK